MSAEAKRGCGYRKVGGLYLVADRPAAPCCRLPLPLDVCPCCAAGIKQTRGWTWINPLLMFKPRERAFNGDGVPAGCRGAACAMFDPSAMGERCGLLWIGEQFYPTAAHFTAESAQLGVSRRLRTVPRGFKAGETWVLLAHPKAVSGQSPGVFAAIRPRGFELIVKQSDYDAALAEYAAFVELGGDDRTALGALGARYLADRDRGVAWVPVPDNDRDHQGSVFDKDDADDDLVGSTRTVNDGESPTPL